jgi:DNA-binding transcriptional LysR family regulator
MARENINDILVLLAVAKERSFTRAAAKLGMTQSALSHIIRSLEARMGVRLLTRTTRSVSPTAAGERLIQNVGPRLEEIEVEIAAVSDLGDKPAGTVRITAIDHVIDNVLWPRLSGVLYMYPDIHVELSADYRMIDVAAERFDIGVRLGDQVDRDMVAVRITTDIGLMIVGSPAYFSRRPIPHSAKDLQKHNCIGMRLSSGRVYAWELQHDGVKIELRPTGQVVCNSAYQVVRTALSGNGLAFLTADVAAQYVLDGRLISVMQDWCPTFPGLHAYYPSRRYSSRALQIVIEAIRYRAESAASARADRL